MAAFWLDASTLPRKISELPKRRYTRQLTGGRYTRACSRGGIRISYQAHDVPINVFTAAALTAHLRFRNLLFGAVWRWRSRLA